MRTKTATKKTKTAKHSVVLGLGSNLGNREGTLRLAIEWLEELCGPLAVAPFYSSRPLSLIAQPNYRNTIVIAPLPTRGLQPLNAARSFLEKCKRLEHRAGRRPGPRFGPRPLDIDLLLFGDLVHQDPVPLVTQGQPTTPRWLTLPHPRMRQRRFVLAPLHDLAPGLEIPPDGTTVQTLLGRLGNDQSVTKLG